MPNAEQMLEITSSDYTVKLELPELCDPGDYPTGATPIQAVEEFISAVQGSPDLWAYLVTENGGERRSFLVDMASGSTLLTEG